MSDGGDSVDFRPPSDNLVDLHISIVPLEHWVERLNYASHKVIGDTFSVGFIRVLPDISIAKLRMELKVQLGHDFFPKDYVFLKHIGRCLALVRQNQEKQLKVKNFLPPHSVMPEIFVLPGHPTMYNYSVLPPIKPRIQDLHKPISETESVSPENISYERRQSIPQQQQHPPSFGEIDSLSASYNNTPQNTRYIGKDQSLGHSNQVRHSLGSETSTTKAKFKSPVVTPPENRDIKRQRRHISGKSENHQNFPKGQRGRTTPGQAFDVSRKTIEKQNERQLVNPAYIENEGNEKHELSQTKSVIHEGPVKRKVHYNMPARSGSLASSRAASSLDFPKDVEMPPRFPHRYKSMPSPNSLSSHPLLPPNYINPHPPKAQKRQFVDTSSRWPLNTSSQGYHAMHVSTKSAINTEDTFPFKFDNRPISRSSGASSCSLHNPPLPANHINPAYSYQPKTLGMDEISHTHDEMEDKPPTNSTNDDSGYLDQEQSDTDVSSANELQRHRIGSLAQPDDKGNSSSKQENVEMVRTLVHNKQKHNLDTMQNNSPGMSSTSPFEGYKVFPGPALDPLHTGKPNATKKTAATTISGTDNHVSPDHHTNNLGGNPWPSVTNVNYSSNDDDTPERNANASQARPPSQDSSYQFDFYDRSGPNKSISPKHPNNPLSSNHKSNSTDRETNGSKLSYRLSEQNFQIYKSGERDSLSGHDPQFPPDLETSSQDSFSETPPQNLNHSAKNQKFYNHYEAQPVGKQYDNHDGQISTDNEEDDYESSEDEFQKELQLLAEKEQRQGKVDEDFHNYFDVQIQGEAKMLPRKHESSLPDMKLKPELKPGHPNPFEQIQQPVDKVNEGETLPKEGIGERESISGLENFSKRDSVSGSSEVLPNPSTTTAVIGFVTTDDNLAANNKTIEMADKKLLKTHDLDKSVSRGAPDGMPTQRKVNTGGKPQGAIIPSPVAAVQKPWVAELADLTPDDIEQKLKDKDEKKNFLTKPSKNASVIMDPQKKMPAVTSNNNTPVVQRDPVQQQPSPSPIRIPQFHKPPVEQQEMVTSPVSPKGLLNSKGKALVTTSKHQQGSAQEVTLDKRKDKETAKRLDSSHRSKLWRELQEVRNQRRQAEKERQDLVKQAKVTTSKLNQKRISVSAAPPSERPRFPRIKSGKKKQHGPGEKCNVSGCYYVFHTNMDKKRHFGLIHRGKPMGPSVPRQDSSSALNWKRSILTQESLSSVGDNRQQTRRKSAFGSSLPRLAPSDRKVRFSLTEESAKAPPPSQGQAYWASEPSTSSQNLYASYKVSESIKPSYNTKPPTKYRLRFFRDMWKKKFFEEKKRTMPLEEICRRLQVELDSSHQRLVSALEGDQAPVQRRYPSFLPTVVNRPSVKSNNKIQVTRLQHDMDGLMRRIEDAKIKLTGEIKLRHQAEQDVKVLRQELMTKKIRVHVAYRESLRSHNFTVKA